MRVCRSLPRLLVLGLRLLAFADLSLDLALADLHAQPVDGRVLRQREDVDAFDPVRGSRS